MKLAAAIFLIGLAACAAPRLGTLRGGARILASPGEAARLRAIVERYEPSVIERLGSRWPRGYTIEVRELDGHFLGVADDDTKAVVLSPQALEREDLAEILVHELVHVHAVGHWTELPYAVEEGLAFWLSSSLVQEVERYAGPEPEPEALWRALTITADEYQDPANDTRAVDQAATWLASRLLEGASW